MQLGYHLASIHALARRATCRDCCHCSK
jgi:hypothetical protein